MTKKVCGLIADKQYEFIKKLIKAGNYNSISDFVNNAVRRLNGDEFGTQAMEEGELKKFEKILKI